MRPVVVPMPRVFRLMSTFRDDTTWPPHLWSESKWHVQLVVYDPDRQACLVELISDPATLTHFGHIPPMRWAAPSDVLPHLSEADRKSLEEVTPLPDETSTG